jgi:hypothetical protein
MIGRLFFDESDYNRVEGWTGAAAVGCRVSSRGYPAALKDATKSGVTEELSQRAVFDDQTLASLSAS